MKTSVTADSSKRPAVSVFTSTVQVPSANPSKRRKLIDVEMQNRENVHINLHEPLRPSIPMRVKGSAPFFSPITAAHSIAAEAKSILPGTTVAAPINLVKPIPLHRSNTALLATKGKAVVSKDPVQRKSNMCAVQTVRRAGSGTGTETETEREKGAVSEKGAGAGAGRREVRCVEVVRRKSDREALPGHQCTECSAYYEALVQQGMVTEGGLEEMLKNCSRHKVRLDPV